MANHRLILASTSRFRKALLERLKIDFTAISPEVDENEISGEPPIEMAKRLSVLKARAVHERFPDSVVIGSDQVPEFEGGVLRKPETAENALVQLRSMSGKAHLLHTGCCVINEQGDERVFVNTAKLWMRENLTDAQLRAYIQTDHPVFCAGSYMLEASGIALFSRIECNDWSAITGLPLIDLTSILVEWGVSPFQNKLP